MFCAMGPEAFLACCVCLGGFYHSFSAFGLGSLRHILLQFFFKECVYLFYTYYSFDTIPLIIVLSYILLKNIHIFSLF